MRLSVRRLLALVDRLGEQVSRYGLPVAGGELRQPTDREFVALVQAVQAGLHLDGETLDPDGLSDEECTQLAGEIGAELEAELGRRGHGG